MGHLSALTGMNISILQRVREHLPNEDAQRRLVLATYDEPTRFKVVLVDDRLAVVQPYLSGIRGLNSPTLLLRRFPGREGLFPAFRQTFSWLWDHSSPAC